MILFMAESIARLPHVWPVCHATILTGAGADCPWPILIDWWYFTVDSLFLFLLYTCWCSSGFAVIDHDRWLEREFVWTKAKRQNLSCCPHSFVLISLLFLCTSEVQTKFIDFKIKFKDPFSHHRIPSSIQVFFFERSIYLVNPTTSG